MGNQPTFGASSAIIEVREAKKKFDIPDNSHYFLDRQQTTQKQKTQAINVLIKQMFVLFYPENDINNMYYLYTQEKQCDVSFPDGQTLQINFYFMRQTVFAIFNALMKSDNQQLFILLYRRLRGDADDETLFLPLKKLIKHFAFVVTKRTQKNQQKYAPSPPK